MLTQHDSQVVNQHADQQNKFTARCGDQPEAIDVKKKEPNLVCQRYEEKPTVI